MAKVHDIYLKFSKFPKFFNDLLVFTIITNLFYNLRYKTFSIALIVSLTVKSLCPFSTFGPHQIFNPRYAYAYKYYTTVRVILFKTYTIPSTISKQHSTKSKSTCTRLHFIITCSEALEFRQGCNQH